MSATAVHTWTCPGCGRHVPLRVATCHCGVQREQAAAARKPTRAPAAPAAADGSAGLWKTLPRDVRALVVGAALVVAVGAAWLAFVPPAPNRTPSVLGYVDVPHPVQPTPPPPRLNLPWWK